jgi:hypothetical protein
MHHPLCVYNNWASYDELSDNVELTEELAMQQLHEMLRLRGLGVHMDYYLMDAFWYARDGAYRTWRKPHWPLGPDRWLGECRQKGITPGLWVATNALSFLDVSPFWEGSLDARRGHLCMYRGGFLNHFMETLQYWYDRGVRMYKFDFADLSAANEDAAATHLPDEIRQNNSAALRAALVAFRRRNPAVLFLGYNGFGGDQDNTTLPYRKSVDARWLDAFDSLYCGDPRPADVPAMNFWRSKDIYSDHMVRQYEQNGIPLERIDNTSFMIGVTGTCYNRRTAAWKGMLILSLARGGWMNLYYGNLELLSDEDAAWFARAQDLYLPLQGAGRTAVFGGVPGQRKPYGYVAFTKDGAVYTVVNPSQSVQTIELPQISPYQLSSNFGSLLFHDAGYRPSLGGNLVTLGAEQMAVVGFGKYVAAAYDLGVQTDVISPNTIRPVETAFTAAGRNQIAATVAAPDTDLRIIMTQTRNGLAYRSTRGAPPNGKTLGTVLKIAAEQTGTDGVTHALPVRTNYDKAIWSGLSWAAGEIDHAALTPDQPVRITCTSAEPFPLELAGEVYEVTYGN